METFKKGIKMKDDCVSCGEKTEYDKCLHIDYRNYYVEGAGQLCGDCWKKIFKHRDGEREN